MSPLRLLRKIVPESQIGAVKIHVVITIVTKPGEMVMLEYPDNVRAAADEALRPVMDVIVSQPNLVTPFDPNSRSLVV